MPETTQFQIRANDGAQTTLFVKTGVYRNAAAAVPALLGLDLPVEVDIWTEFNRFRYRISENEFGQFLVEHMVKTAQPVAQWRTDHPDETEKYLNTLEEFVAKFREEHK